MNKPVFLNSIAGVAAAGVGLAAIFVFADNNLYKGIVQGISLMVVLFFIVKTNTEIRKDSDG